jgi:hypothetical protein
MDTGRRSIEIAHDQLAPYDPVVKTESGKLEIMIRAQGLPSRLRRLLIMIDGTRSVSQLEQTFARLGNVGAMLHELRDRGLIAVRSLRSESAVAPSSEAVPLPPSFQADPLTPKTTTRPVPMAPELRDRAVAWTIEPHMADRHDAPPAPIPFPQRRSAPPAAPPVDASAPPSPSAPASIAAYGMAPGPVAEHGGAFLRRPPATGAAPTTPAHSRVATFPTGMPIEAAAIASPAQQVLELAQIKASVRAHLTGVLGSYEALIDAKLEAVADFGQLRSFLLGAENVLSTYGGIELSRKFRERFRNYY